MKLIKPEAYDIRGVCITCQIKPQRSKGKYKGKSIYGPECQKCHDIHTNKTSKRAKQVRLRLKQNVGLKCQLCGFIAQHSCQIDIDHIDGNHENEAPNNLQQICANCHRLKTMLNRDWEK